MADWFPTFRKQWRNILITGFLLVAGALAIGLLFFVDFHRHTMIVNGVERDYLLYVPSSRDQALKPLVLAYHGFSGNATRMAKNSKLHELVSTKDFYLVYLNGDPTWQFVIPEDTEISPDVVFFDMLCDTLIKDYPIDANRIYVVGMSKGGDFALYLAERRSPRIAAVVSQGACITDAFEAERHFPMMFIAGTKDGEVPPDRLARVTQDFRDHGHIVEVIRPENIGHCWYVPLNERIWQFLSAHEMKQETDL